MPSPPPHSCTIASRTVHGKVHDWEKNSRESPDGGLASPTLWRFVRIRESAIAFDGTERFGGRRKRYVRRDAERKVEYWSGAAKERVRASCNDVIRNAQGRAVTFKYTLHAEVHSTLPYEGMNLSPGGRALASGAFCPPPNVEACPLVNVT